MEISFTQAEERYGIPVKYFRTWRRFGGLNEFSGLVERGKRSLIETKTIEKKLGLRPIGEAVITKCQSHKASEQSVSRNLATGWASA